MTPEPPRTARRNRPDAQFRRRALGVPAAPDEPAPPAVGAGTTPSRESFRDVLARIPDLGDDRDDRGDEAPTPATPPAAPRVARPERRAALAAAASAPAAPEAPVGVVPDEPSTPAATAVAPPGEAEDTAAPVDPAPPVVPDEPVDRSEPIEDPVDEPPARRPGARQPVRREVPRWRQVTFAAVLLGLVAAIPLLGGAGYRLVTESTDGKEGSTRLSPTDPGFEQLVTSTPTAVVLQSDPFGRLVGATFLSLGAESGGGSVIFVPVDTLAPNPYYGLDRVRSPYEFEGVEPGVASAGAAGIVGEVLDVGVDEVIPLDDQAWTDVIAPVGPLTVDNLDMLDIGGVALPTGEVELPAELVGPYLAVQREGEDELARIARQEQVWRAWLQAVAASSLEDKVPGESSSGLGLFIRTLAAGEVSFQTIPGTQVDGATPGFEPDAQAIATLVADAVPAPLPATPGSRRTMRLLNGVAPEALPAEVLRAVAALDGSVLVMGNGPDFDQATSTVIYRDPENEDYAELLAASLGATGPVELDETAPETIDVTVIFGRDILGDAPATTTTVAGAPSSTDSTTASGGT